MLRIIFAIKNLILYRKNLRQFLVDKNLQASSITDLDPVILKRLFKLLIIDFDGVLAPHGQSQALPEHESWLKRCSNTFGEKKMYILSNKPTPQRQVYFNDLGLKFIISNKKKPYPDGIYKILANNCSPHEALVIDDRLATGILAAIIAKTSALLIVNAETNFSHSPVKESFFAVLRFLERKVINLFA